jgi:hypothetical protein
VCQAFCSLVSARRYALGAALVAVEQSALNIVLSAIAILDGAGPSWASSNAATLAGWVPALVSAAELGCATLVRAFGGACGDPLLAPHAGELSDLVQTELQRLFLSLAAKFNALAQRVPSARERDAAYATTSLGFGALQGSAPVDAAAKGSSPGPRAPDAQSIARPLQEGSTSAEQLSEREAGTEEGAFLSDIAPPAPFRCSFAVAAVDFPPELTHILLVVACRVRYDAHILQFGRHQLQAD